MSGVLRRTEQTGRVNVKVIGALSKGQEGRALSEIQDMLTAGAVAISDDGRYVTNAGLFANALEYAKMLDCLVISHAEGESLAEGYIHSVCNAWPAWQAC